ncbi:MAG: histidine kinase [Oscillospiraceae bacterium]|nr:histidine kinase [Oscillospiraceae bacterium]
MQRRKRPLPGFRHVHLRQFLISAVVPILVLSIILSSYYLSQSLNIHKTSSSDMMDTAASVLTSDLSEIEQISFTPYLYSDIEQIMIYMYNGYLRDDSDAPAALKIATLETNYTMLFTKMLHTSRQKIQAITFYPFGVGYTDSYTISRSAAGIRYAQVEASAVGELYSITENYDTLPVFLQLDSGDPDTYTLLRTIRDIDTQKDLGILRIDIKTDLIIDCIHSVTVTERSGLLLLDALGNQIYAIGETDSRLIEMALSGKTEGRCGIHLYQFEVRDIKGCRLIHICSVDDVLNSFVDSFVIILGVILLAYTMTFLLYRKQSASSFNSIEAILEAIRQLQQGNLDYQCQVHDGKEEYQVIVDAVNEMGQNLKALIRAEADARDSQSRAEFMALQSQINPHFLYNTLNGFIALNRMGESKQLEISILQLTKLFRHICSRSDAVTVDQEYQFASQYLQLQQLRFDDRIAYHIDLEGEASRQLIPKLIIQPLVENSIVHGMEESDRPIEITLRAYIEEDTLVLVIEDTGVGFDLSILETSPRVGLKNVMNRLELFRKGSRYEVDSTPGMGTLVRLMIPLTDDGQEAEHENTACR